MKWLENFATAALISFTFASTNEENGENIGAVRRNRDFSLSRLPRVIASDNALSFRFIFLAFTDVRLKPVEADNEEDFGDLYIGQPIARVSHNLYDVNIWQRKDAWTNSKFII